MNQSTIDQILLTEIVFGCKKMSEHAKERRKEIIDDFVKFSEFLTKIKQDDSHDHEEIKNNMQNFFNGLEDSFNSMRGIIADLVGFLDVVVMQDQRMRKDD